ncbi:MAG: hypothetical protein OEU46_00060 [Alphaproteobacteria bacterium]|nr:hypothetical protein [Alphaproteobacteria bacterium]
MNEPAPATPRTGDGARLHRINHKRWAVWLLCLFLVLPIIYSYVLHFAAVPDGHRGTGFLQYDQPYYMANAREHFDGGKFSFLYGLPFSNDPSTPRIYVQILSLFLGMLHQLTNLDPGYIYFAFGLIAALVCARIAIALYDDVIGRDKAAQQIGLICFFWGGGLFAIAGVLYAVLIQRVQIFAFDPQNGYWFLNFGRNLFYPTEAFYHAVFFGTVLMCFRRRYGLAAIGLAVMAISHPFTGLQLLLIVGAWTALERIILRTYDPPRFLLFVAIILSLLHVGYYLGVLNISSEHRSLQQQWSLAWILDIKAILLAYALVGGLIVVRFLWRDRFALPWSNRQDRFFIVWFVVSLVLANHDLLIEPRQPIHFTRGYIWIPLFFLGAPVLVHGIQHVLDSRTAILSKLAVAAGLLLFLSDNAAWFAGHGYRTLVRDAPLGITLSDEMSRVLAIMNAQKFRGSLIISEDAQIGYLATVYTPLRSWRSHKYNTPFKKQRDQELNRFFASGIEAPQWRDQPILLLRTKGEHFEDLNWLENFGFLPIFDGASYSMYARPGQRSQKN